MRRKLRSRVVAVTRARSGAGRATTRAFRFNGACVGLLARNEDASGKAANELEEAGSAVRSRLPQHPQPVPPIYQVEDIAQATLSAARHAPRELWIATSAIKANVRQRVMPGLLDWYLGRVGHHAQQTVAPSDPRRGDHLYRPLPQDFGAQGDFGAHSRRQSLLLTVRRRPWLTAGATLPGGIAPPMLAARAA